MRTFLLNIGHFQTHFFLLLYPTVVLTLERQGGGSYGDLLLPATAAWVAFAGFTLPAAWAGDRFPKPRLMLLLFLGLALGSGLAALSQNTWQLTAGLAVIGAAAAIYHPVGIALLVEQSAQTGRAIGVNGVWGNLGVAAAPLAAAAMAEGLGWRWAFALPALLALATAVAYRGSGARRAAPLEEAAPNGQIDRGGLLRILLFFLASGLCGGLLFNALTIALPKVIEGDLGRLVALGDGGLEVGLLATAIFTAAAFSQIVSGRLLDRLPLRALAGGITLAQVFALLLLAVSSGLLALLAALAAVALVFAEIPVGDTLIKRVASPALRARAYGLVYMLTFAAAAGTVPLVSLIYESDGDLDLLLWLLAGAAALLSAAAWSLPRGRTDPQALRFAAG